MINARNDLARSPNFELTFSPSCCLLLRRFAQERARRAGVLTEDLDDCAAEFVLKMFLLYKGQRESKLMYVSHAWVCRCAEHHAIDFRRREASRHEHEARLLPDWAEGSACACHARTPETECWAKEYQAQISSIIACLTPSQQDLFMRLIVREDTVAEAACATERTPQAIRQSRFNLFRQLRKLCERRNVTERQLREYILLIERAGG